LNGYSRLAIIGGLISIAAFATAGVMFVTSGDESIQRLGLLFALFGAIVTGLISALRSDQSASNTDKTSGIATALDGALELRVRNAVRDVRNEDPTSAREVEKRHP